MNDVDSVSSNSIKVRIVVGYYYDAKISVLRSFNVNPL